LDGQPRLTPLRTPPRKRHLLLELYTCLRRPDSENHEITPGCLNDPWQGTIIRNRLILQNNIEGVDNAGDVTKDGEEDVDKKIGAASTLKEDSKRREDDGKDDLADVACCERHCV